MVSGETPEQGQAEPRMKQPGVLVSALELRLAYAANDILDRGVR